MNSSNPTPKPPIEKTAQGHDAYTLTTIEQVFELVPRDKINHFAADLANCMDAYHATKDAIAKADVPGLGVRTTGSMIWIDGNGNYEPKNCRWATPKEQAANRKKYTLTKLSTEAYLAREFGIPPSKLKKRIKSGWSITQALTSKRAGRLIVIDGQSKTITQWAEHRKMTYQQIKKRINLGWTDRDAIMVPIGGMRPR